MKKSAIWGILKSRDWRNEHNWGSVRQLLQTCKRCAEAFCLYAYLGLIYNRLPANIPYQECALKRAARARGIRSDCVMSCREQLSDWPKRPVKMSRAYMTIEGWDHKVPCEACWHSHPCVNNAKDGMQNRLYAMRYGIYPLMEVVGS